MENIQALVMTAVAAHAGPLTMARNSPHYAPPLLARQMPGYAPCEIREALLLALADGSLRTTPRTVAGKRITAAIVVSVFA